MSSHPAPAPSPNDLSDIELVSVVTDGGRGAEWNIAHRNLQTLRCPPTSPLSFHLSRVTTLDISNNNLQSLRGVALFPSLEMLDASYNKIRVGDMSTLSDVTKLTRLCSLDISHNFIQRMELEEFGVISSSRTQRLQSEAMRLTLIDLSFNKLMKLPDVRLAPALEVLHLDNNLIEDLLDIENKLPLNNLHTVHLAGNRIAQFQHMVPLAALAPTLHQLTISGNPFALTTDQQSPSGAGPPPCRWWRPLLLWLCPLLVSIDQVDLSPEECHVAGQLFRERGKLSKQLMELLNPQQRSQLMKYVMHMCPPHPMLSEEAEMELAQDELAYIAGEALRESSTAVSPSIAPMDPPPVQVPPLFSRTESAMAYEKGLSSTTPAAEGDAEEEDSSLNHSSFMNTSWGGGPTTAISGSAPPPPPVYEADEDLEHQLEVEVDEDSHSKQRMQQRRTTHHLAQPAIQQSPLMEESPGVTPQDKREHQRYLQQQLSNDSLSNSHHVLNVTSSSGGSTTAVAQGNLPIIVKAMQAKLKTLSGVVETLWRADMTRRTHAAIVIQKYMRATLVKMHLSPDEREACRFIRSQLNRQISPQHLAALAEAAFLRSQHQTPSRNGSDSGIRSGHTDVSADLQEVLQNMRSLQQVFSTMWKDLEAYRLMAGRERRRAAVTIQRYFRGYLGRKVHKVLQEGYKAFVDSLVPLVELLQRTGRGWLSRRRLAKEVVPQYKIRCLEAEVKELRETLTTRLAQVEMTIRKMQVPPQHREDPR